MQSIIFAFVHKNCQCASYIHVYYVIYVTLHHKTTKKLPDMDF